MIIGNFFSVFLSTLGEFLRTISIITWDYVEDEKHMANRKNS